MTNFADQFNPSKPSPSCPPDVTPEEWRRYVMRVIIMARSVRNLQNVPSHVLDHMRDVLLGEVKP